MKLEDAIKIGLGISPISLATAEEALTVMAAELEMMRTQEPVAAVERVHGQICLQFGDGRTIYDMPVGMKLFAHPVVALKHSLEQTKIKDDLIASLEAQCKDLASKLSSKTNTLTVDELPKHDGQAQTSRYDWSKAPEWAMWAATEQNGNVWYYNDKPKKGYKGWVMAFKDGSKTARCWNLNISAISDWQSSLEKRPQSATQRVEVTGEGQFGVELPPVRHGVQSDYPFDGATIHNVKPARFVETNAHEIDLKRVQCISRPNEKGRYFVTLVSGIDLPVEDNLYPHAVLSKQWRAYGEAN